MSEGEGVLVGVCRVALRLSGVGSLKEKRSVVRRLLERARGRHPVSAAEVGEHDRHERAILGFAVASNDEKHAQSVLAAVIREVEGAGLASIERVRTQVLHAGAFERSAETENATLSWEDFEAGPEDEEERA